MGQKQIAPRVAAQCRLRLRRKCRPQERCAQVDASDGSHLALPPRLGTHSLGTTVCQVQLPLSPLCSRVVYDESLVAGVASQKLALVTGISGRRCDVPYLECGPLAIQPALHWFDHFRLRRGVVRCRSRHGCERTRGGQIRAEQKSSQYCSPARRRRRHSVPAPAADDWLHCPILPHDSDTHKHSAILQCVYLFIFTHFSCRHSQNHHKVIPTAPSNFQVVSRRRV